MAAAAAPAPSAAAAACEAAEEPWGWRSSFFLCALGEEAQYEGRVQFLDRATFRSVRQAADALNSGDAPCSEGVCAAFSADFQEWYLLFRRGHLKATRELLGEPGAAASTPARGREAGEPLRRPGAAGPLPQPAPELPARGSAGGPTPEPPAAATAAVAEPPAPEPPAGALASAALAAAPLAAAAPPAALPELPPEPVEREAELGLEEAPSGGGAAEGAAAEDAVEGALDVRVLAAHGLAAEDSDFKRGKDSDFSGDVLDPYAVVRLGGVEGRTPAEVDSPSPRWSRGNEFSFVVSRGTGPLEIEVFNAASEQRVQCLGRALVPLEAAPADGSEWRRLRAPLEGGGAAQLELLLRRRPWRLAAAPCPRAAAGAGPREGAQGADAAGGCAGGLVEGSALGVEVTIARLKEKVDSQLQFISELRGRGPPSGAPAVQPLPARAAPPRARLPAPPEQGNGCTEDGQQPSTPVALPAAATGEQLQQLAPPTSPDWSQRTIMPEADPGTERQQQLEAAGGLSGSSSAPTERQQQPAAAAPPAPGAAGGAAAPPARPLAQPVVVGASPPCSSRASPGCPPRARAAPQLHRNSPRGDVATPPLWPTRLSASSAALDAVYMWVDCPTRQQAAALAAAVPVQTSQTTAPCPGLGLRGRAVGGTAAVGSSGSADTLVQPSAPLPQPRGPSPGQAHRHLHGDLRQTLASQRSNGSLCASRTSCSTLCTLANVGAAPLVVAPPPPHAHSVAALPTAAEAAAQRTPAASPLLHTARAAISPAVAPRAACGAVAAAAPTPAHPPAFVVAGQRTPSPPRSPTRAYSPRAGPQGSRQPGPVRQAGQGALGLLYGYGCCGAAPAQTPPQAVGHGGALPRRSAAAPAGAPVVEHPQAAAVAAAVVGVAAAALAPPPGPDGARASSVPVRTVRRVIGTTYQVLPQPAAAAEEAPRAAAEPAPRPSRPWTPQPGGRSPWTPQLAARASRGSLRPWEAAERVPPALAGWATPQLRLTRSLSPRSRYAAQVAAAGRSSPPPGGYVVLQSTHLHR